MRTVPDGPLDHVVLNPGGTFRPRPFGNLSRQELVESFEENVAGPLQFLQRMYERINEGGSVVVRASVSGLAGSKFDDAYGASMAALHYFRAFDRLFAQRGVRLNVIAPGPHDTPMLHAALGEERLAALRGQLPSGRLGDPKEFAELVYEVATNPRRHGQLLGANGESYTPGGSFFFNENHNGREEGLALAERFMRHADAHGYKDRPFVEATLRKHPTAIARWAYADPLFDKVWWELSAPDAVPLKVGDATLERAVVYRLGIGGEIGPDCIYADALPAVHVVGAGDIVYRDPLAKDPTLHTREGFGNQIEAILNQFLVEGNEAMAMSGHNRQRLLRYIPCTDLASYSDCVTFRPGYKEFLGEMLGKIDSPSEIDLLLAFVALQDPVVYRKAVINPLLASGNAARATQWDSPLDLADISVKLRFAAGELAMKLF